MKKIKPKAVDFRSLKLSAEEGFVLSRIDGPTTVKDLADLTALEEARVVAIVARLAGEGAVDLEDAPGGGLVGSGSAAPSGISAGATADRADPRAEEDGYASGNEGEDDASEREGDGDASEREGDGDAPESEGDDDGDDASANRKRSDAASDARTERDEASADGDGEPDPESAESDAELDEQDRVFVSNERLYREVYAAKFKGRPLDERIAAATKADGSELLALCLDPDPQVVYAIMQNPKTGLEQARALGFHHRTHMGLETVAKRAEFLADNFVQRKLLRNPQLPDSILRRIVSRKVLIEVYKIAIDREIPERTRSKVRVELRKKFMLATADERAALLVKTEARVLVLLVDCALDARTTQILISRSGYSILFVQNVARWSPSPPKLLAHLVGLQTVRRNPGTRKMLLRHPNMPSEVKKKFA